MWEHSEQFLDQSERFDRYEALFFYMPTDAKSKPVRPAFCACALQKSFTLRPDLKMCLCETLVTPGKQAVMVQLKSG